jgi:hypothetical protein
MKKFLFIASMSVALFFTYNHRKELKEKTLISRIPAQVEAASSFGVLGDIEGNWERFKNFVDLGDPLFWTEDGRVGLKPGRKFAFVGDAIDRGNGSMRILDVLNELKETYGDDVVLIRGNRDINKMRLLHELTSEALALPPRNPNVQDAAVDYSEWLDGREHNKINRLKYIFEKTMNAGQAFENRRAEMALFKGINPGLITDSDVFDSFMKDFEPGQRMHRFLSHAQSAAYIDGNLLVHGAVNEENLGKFIDSRKKGMSLEDFKSQEDLGRWVDELNKESSQMFRQWDEDRAAGFPKASELLDRALKDPEYLSKFYESPEWMHLVRYQEPIPGTRSNPASTIYGRYSDADGNPIMPKKDFVKKLKKLGLLRIIVGHTPAGDIPVLMRELGVEILLVDNSYSKATDVSKIIVHGRELEIISQTGEHGVVKLFNKKSIRNGFYGAMIAGKRVIGTNEKGEYVLLKFGVVDGKPFTAQYETMKLNQLVRKLECRQILNFNIF